MLNSYSIAYNSTDLAAALRCEAKAAAADGLKNLADRQEAVALHIDNAMHQMQAICPEGHHVTTEIVFSFAPSVIATLKPEFRR